MKRLTPLKAIRKKCLWCCGGSADEVRHCPADRCALHPYRHGHGRAKLATIKAKCMDCDPEGWRTCDGQLQDGQCTLWPYRLGRNPNITAETRRKRSERAKLTPRNFAETRQETPTRERETVLSMSR